MEKTVFRVGKKANGAPGFAAPHVVLNGGGKPFAKVSKAEHAELVVNALHLSQKVNAQPGILELAKYEPLLRLGIRVIPAVDGGFPVFLAKVIGFSASNHLVVIPGASILPAKFTSSNPDLVKKFKKCYGKDLFDLAQHFVLDLVEKHKKELEASLPKAPPAKKAPLHEPAKKPVVAMKKESVKVLAKQVGKKPVSVPKGKALTKAAEAFDQFANAVKPPKPVKTAKPAPNPAVATKAAKPKPSTVKAVKKAQEDEFGVDWPDPLA